MEVTQALANVPLSKDFLHYFNGFQWSRCDGDGLKRDIKAITDVLKELLDRKNQCLGFCCSPFLGLPALILGAVASSCPFIFLDFDKMGNKTRSTLFEKLQVSWLVSDRSLGDASLELHRVVVICATKLFVYKNVELPVTSIMDENYLYGVTTSGSTGTPKIVRVPAESILPNVYDFSHRLSVNSNDVILLSSALTFDPSMVEFFLAILNGASLVIISDDVKSNTNLLFEAIRDGKVTFYQTTPSLFRLWSTETQRTLLGINSPLNHLILGGEPFPSESEVKMWEPCDKIRIYNTYGITEVSCWATLKLVWPFSDWNLVDGRVDIGDALSSTFIKSEIHTSSGLHHISIGSSSRVCAIEDETFESLRGELVFRSTGDLFKIVDGKYYFCHRTDSAIKRLGKMFNLALVEEKAMTLNLNCTVVKTGPSDDCSVVLFVVGERSSSELHAKLRSLKSSLPTDHWPDHVAFIEFLPVTAHGKLDKAALLDALACSRSRSVSERTFEELWSYFTLGPVTKLSGSNFKKMGFISSGGNSLNAVLFVNSLREHGVDVNPDLMVLLLKDAPFSDCLALFKEVCEGDGHGSKTPQTLGDTQAKESTAMLTAAASCPDESMISPTMALKGRVWPRRMPCSSNIWDQEQIKFQPEWKIDLKKCVDASALVIMIDEDGQDCLIIVGSHSGIVVVLGGSGEIKAKTQLPDRVEASACLSSDARSFYIGCYDGKVYKIRINDGVVMWEFTTGDMVKCTAVVHENKIFFGSYDKNIYAVNEGGTIMWKREVGAVTVPVLIHKSSIIVGTLTGKIVILGSGDGHEYLSFSVGAPIFANLLLTHLDKVSSLLICPVNGFLEWRNTDEAFRKVHAFNCPGTVFAAPIPVNNTDFIITSGTTLQYYQPSKCLWSCNFDHRIVATPFLIEKWPLAASRLVVITSDGELTVLDLKSGVPICSYRFPGEVFSSPVVLGRKIFVGCRDNYFHCVSVA